MNNFMNLYDLYVFLLFGFFILYLFGAIFCYRKKTYFHRRLNEETNPLFPYLTTEETLLAFTARERWSERFIDSCFTSFSFLVLAGFCFLVKLLAY